MADDNAYLALREANIKRNNEIMRMLGLDSEDFKLHEAQSAKGKKPAKAESGGAAKKRKSSGGTGDPEDDEGKDGDGDEDWGGKRTRRSGREPSRRSSRVQGISAELGPDDLPDDADRPRSMGRDMNATEEEHDEAERDYLRWAGRQKKQTIVGTASYAHTLMRVRTMSEQALANRIKTIERAKGQHAVVKMKLFAQILCLEKYEDLSAVAAEAYKRLADFLGEPVPEPEEGSGKVIIIKQEG